MVLRGSLCKNRPLEFRKITEFLHIFCVKEVIHKMISDAFENMLKRLSDI